MSGLIWEATAVPDCSWVKKKKRKQQWPHRKTQDTRNFALYSRESELYFVKLFYNTIDLKLILITFFYI